jgi:hypothetical protein
MHSSAAADTLNLRGFADFSQEISTARMEAARDYCLGDRRLSATHFMFFGRRFCAKVARRSANSAALT